MPFERLANCDFPVFDLVPPRKKKIIFFPKIDEKAFLYSVDVGKKWTIYYVIFQYKYYL